MPSLGLGLSISSAKSIGGGTPPPPDPPPLPDYDDLVLQVEADSLELSNGDPVSLWTDISQQANDLSQPTSNKQPMFKQDGTGPLGLPYVKGDGVNDQIDSPNSPSLILGDAQGSIIGLVFRTTLNDSFPFTHFNASDNNGWAIRLLSGQSGFENGGGWEYGGEQVNDGAWHCLVVRNINGYGVAILDGLVQFVIPMLSIDGPALIGAVSASATLFNLANNLAPCNTDIFAAFAYGFTGGPSNPSPKYVQDIFARYTVKCGTPSRGDSLHYICHQGDSITFGTNAPAGQTYPEQLNVLLGGPSVFAFQNFGIVGATINTGFPSISRNSPSEWGNILNHSTDFFYIVIGGGSNDLATAGVSPATALANYKTLFGQARAMFPNATLVALTLLPRSDSGISPTFEVDRQTFNAGVRAQTPGPLWDSVADIGNDPNIGQPGDETNLTYYSGDKVHPNGTGYGVIATTVQPLII